MIPSMLYVVLVIGVFAYLYYKGKLGALTSNEGLDLALNVLMLFGWFFFAAPGVAALLGYSLPVVPSYTSNMSPELLLVDIIFRWLVSLVFLVAVVHEEWKEA